MHEERNKLLKEKLQETTIQLQVTEKNAEQTNKFLKEKLQETTLQLQMTQKKAEQEKSKLLQLLQNMAKERDEANNNYLNLQQRFKQSAENSNYFLVPVQLFNMPENNNGSATTPPPPPPPKVKNTQLLQLFQDSPVRESLKRERDAT